MKKFHIIIYLFLLLGTACTSTNAGHSHEDDDHSHEDDHAHGDEEHDHAEEEEEGLIELNSTQLRKIKLRFGKIEQKNLKSMLKVNGQMELPPQNQADVSALAPGRITKIHVKPGQFIKRGAVLATLQNPDFIEWQQAYLETKGELMFLEKELARQQDLVKKEIAAQKQLDQVESSHAIASARLKGLTSKLETIGLPIPEDASATFTAYNRLTSPITGYIREIKINTGSYVSTEQELFEIVDNHHLHIDLTVFEKDIPYISEGQKLLFSLQSNPKEVMEAEVFAIGKALDEELRAIKVHAEMVSEKPTVLPGMYVEARIILEDQSVAALPEEAITVDKGLRFIFVKDHVDGDHVAFRKVQVIPGAQDFGYVEVTPLEDLLEETQVVTAGAYFLMAESKKGEEGGGHSHSH
ncbi:MAG: efflux RND transporter periplasmic adaptor subunit [Saprospiraceae bacterium]|nr:efflux RND transporter periplasmic adaptor subunit [Saprospiraceae bacterium]